MRAIATDSNDNEVLIGFNKDESDFYLEFTLNQSSAADNYDNYKEKQKEYIRLNDKHELARLAVVSAEIELREDKPSKH